MKSLALIVGMAKSNRAIGVRGGLPWHVPEDLKRFKALTTGHAIIMGRKTHESIGRALPQRRNIVISRTPRTFAGCECVSSLDEALKLVADDALPFIIGGAQLYAEALPKVTHLFLTEIDQQVEADTFFPALVPSQWREVKRTAGETSGVTFIDLERIP
ncbi:MAG: dihydrofolate reductase [Archangium sp.]